MQYLKAALLGFAIGIFAPGASAQGYQCPLMMPDEVTALEFAYGVQNWLSMFYSSMGTYSAYNFAGFPNSTMMQNNGESLAANLATNMAGLEKQAQLGVDAITQLAGGMDLSSSCDYTYPPGLDASAMDFFMTAYFIEATLCGTFIGLADYVQNPGAAFLMARLSAEHGIHASYLGSYINPTPFSSDSMALTPAFTPDHVLMTGDGTATRANVGYLGEWIPQGCLAVPQAPCGVDVTIGNLTASLSGGDMGGMSAVSTAAGPVFNPLSATPYASLTSGSGYSSAYPYAASSTEGAYPAYSTESGVAAPSGAVYGNGSNPAATSYIGPVVTAVGAAAPGAEVSGSMMAGLFGMLLAALF